MIAVAQHLDVTPATVRFGLRLAIAMLARPRADWLLISRPYLDCRVAVSESNPTIAAQNGYVLFGLSFLSVSVDVNGYLLLSHNYKPTSDAVAILKSIVCFQEKGIPHLSGAGHVISVQHPP
jgi:hypothetical protein